MDINSIPKYQKRIPGAIMSWKLTDKMQDPPLIPFSTFFPQSAVCLVTDKNKLEDFGHQPHRFLLASTVRLGISPL